MDTNAERLTVPLTASPEANRHSGIFNKEGRVLDVEKKQRGGKIRRRMGIRVL
jgi:hypothetical protein